MRLDLGTLALGATLLVNAGEAHAGQKGRTPLAALQEQELAKVQVVIMDSMLSEGYTPQHEATAKSRGFGTYHNPASGAFYVYSKETFQPVDSMASLGVIFKSTQDSYPDALCFSAITFVDEFTRDGQRILVLDEASITNPQVACPEEDKEEAVLEYKPQSGKFVDLEPERIKEGLFWAPMLVVKAGEDVPDELTGSNYIISTQAGGRQTVYKKYTLKDYSPETGVLELIDPVDEKKCMQTRVFKDRIIGVPTRYILSEPGSPEMQEALCEEEVSVSAAPSVPASSAQDTRSKPALRATLLAGVEIDEVVDQPSFGPSAEVAAMLTVRPFPRSQFSVGAMADIIISPQGSGFEGASGLIGSQGDLLGIYGLAGVASEPRWSREDDPTTPEIERDPFDGVLAVGALVTVDLPLKGSIGATCGVSGELLWGGGSFPLNVGVLCGGTFDFSMAKPKHSDPVSELVETVVPEATEDTSMSEQFKFKVRYKVPHQEVKLPKWKGEAPMSDSKFYDNRTALQRNLGGYNQFGLKIEPGSYQPAYRAFQAMEDSGYTLSGDDLFNGAQAASGLGDVVETKRILEIMVQVYPDRQDAKDWLENSITVNYSWVSIDVKEVKPELVLQPVEFAIDPAQRAAVSFANEQLQIEGEHTLLLPKGEYILDGQTITVVEGQTVVIKVK